LESLQASVVMSMDGSDKELFPFIPYILQDLWEIGADTEVIIRLIKNHFTEFTCLKILDLGCGKGAVSVKIAKELGCFCHGIDAIPEFIEFARQKAIEFKADKLCLFENDDIREKVNDLRDYDIVILGAIGPVFGDYFTTLTTVKKCLSKKGVVIIDDGYIEDNSDFTHSSMLKKSVLLKQLEDAGMKIIATDILPGDSIKESDDFIFENLKRRCIELMEQFPDKRHLFIDYIRKQEIENHVLENKVTTFTMVISPASEK
jgi:cyclopropane fatty-acyl-phospholipid synthase-like methyltransferase